MEKIVLYFSARMLPPPDGEAVRYFLELIVALAGADALEIHAGLSAHNAEELGACLPARVTRHFLPGLASACPAAAEREIIRRISPRWIVYSAPDTEDFYPGGEMPARGAPCVAVCVPDLAHLERPFAFAPEERLRRDDAITRAMQSADRLFVPSAPFGEALARAHGHGKARINIADPAAAAEILRNTLSPTAPEPHAAAETPRVTVREPPLVSIVTPSYQQGRFLRQCIESVLTQDYPHIEYFVMDGGSTDASRDILKSYGDRFYWKSERDGGQTNAINAGLKLARGSILAYLNSDDELMPGAVSRVVQAWERRPGVDLFYGRANYTDENGGVIREYPTRPFQIKDFRGCCYICQPAAFWHRRVMDRLGLFDENFQVAMDYEYWQRIAAAGGLIVFLEEFLGCSREYPDTKTLSQRGKVYRDIFASQWLHWGSVHRNWWGGRLAYFRDEERRLWARLLAPESRQRALAKWLEANARSQWPYWERLTRPFTRRRRRAMEESGYLPDGEVSPRLRVPLWLERPATIHLTGVSPESKPLKFTFRSQQGASTETLKVEAGAEFCFRKALPPGQYAVEVTCPPSRVANHPREVGFHLKTTNLFVFRPSPFPPGKYP